MTATAAPTALGAEEPRPASGRPRSGPRWGRAALAAVAYVVALIFIAPYVEMVIQAARPAAESRDASYFPTHWTFSNFTTLWDLGFGHNMVVSLEIAGGATALVLIVALPAAYYTARRPFFGRGAFLGLVLVTQMFQPAAMLVGIQREFLSFDLPSPTLSLILVNAGFNLAFAVWILNAYFSSIPAELEEAAMVDGASRLSALLRITLPLTWPGVVTALIFTFIAAWNEFVVALILSSDSAGTAQPLTVAMDKLVGGYQTDFGHLFAVAAIATVPVIALFAVIERKVVGGLTAGSVK